MDADTDKQMGWRVGEEGQVGRCKHAQADIDAGNQVRHGEQCLLAENADNGMVEAAGCRNH